MQPGKVQTRIVADGYCYREVPVIPAETPEPPAAPVLTPPVSAAERPADEPQQRPEAVEQA